MTSWSIAAGHRSAPFVLAAVVAVLSASACTGGADNADGPDVEPSLEDLEGSCAVEAFELWSVAYPVPPAVRLLYDAAANGYAATLAIYASSSTSGHFDLVRSSRDPLGLGDAASGSLTLVGSDSLLFWGATSLPGSTFFTLSGSVLTLVNPMPRTVTMPPGQWQVTTRLTCRR